MINDDVIIVTSFKNFKRPNDADVSRDKFRFGVKKAPLMPIKGKMYVNSDFKSHALVEKYCRLMVGVSTNELHRKYDELKEKYPDIQEATQLSRIKDVQEHANALFLFLIPHELKRRKQILKKIL